MTLARLFLERYDPLTTYWLPGVLGRVDDDEMRRRPHPRCNSIAWILWHIARVEDAGLNRFVADDPQVFDEGGWAERMNVPLRHHGSGMTLAEVDDLSARIDLAALARPPIPRRGTIPRCSTSPSPARASAGT